MSYPTVLREGGTPYPTTWILWLKEAKPLDVSTLPYPKRTVGGGMDAVPDVRLWM